MILTKAQIKAANVRKTVSVPVPEWGGDVLIRSLSASEAIALGRSLKDKEPNESLALQLAAYLCDENGDAIYTPDDARQELVETGLARPMTRIIERANEENGAGSQEAVKGNS